MSEMLAKSSPDQELPVAAGIVRADLRNPRLALGYLERGAKLNGEIGRGGAGRPTQTSVIVVGHGAEAIAARRASAARIIQPEEAEPLV